jgi:tetratricopeptide (TPR) repeat protein
MFPQLLSACAGLLFGFGACWSLRTGYAEYLARDHAPAALESAIHWMPDNPEYFSRLAEADPASAVNAIRRAAELNPRNASIWIEYGRIAEESGDFHQAEACLLEAARLDRTFAPRWLLSEFYFRRRDPNHFWPAVKAALATSYDDVTCCFKGAGN